MTLQRTSVGPSGTDAAPIPWPVWRLAWVIVFGAFMAGVDASLINVGLVRISTDLDASLSTVQWVSNGYLVAFAVSLPLCGWLGRRVGAGRLWMAALAAFVATSGLCAAAWSVESLIAFRVAQGLSGGLLIPAGQTILGHAVGSARLGRLMATLGIAVTLGPALGPVVGGLILNGLSWPWLFLINVPIGAIALLLGLRFVPRGDARRAGKLDWLGLLYIGSGLPVLLFGLVRWGDAQTLIEARVWLPLGAGVVGMILFVVHARRREQPLLDLRLYRNRVYTAASVAATASGALMFGSGVLFPLYFQILHHESVLTTGILLLSLGGGTAIVLPFAGRMVDRFGGGLVASIGSACTLVTAVPFALLDADANSILVQVLLTLFGMAIALCAVPTGIAAYKTVTAAQLPDATTQVNIVLRVGGATGGSAFTVVLASQLARGEAQAFQTTFWWLTATSLLALVGSLWLHRELRRADSAGEADLDGRPPCADRLPRVRPSGDRPRTGILTETQD